MKYLKGLGVTFTAVLIGNLIYTTLLDIEYFTIGNGLSILVMTILIFILSITSKRNK